MSVRKNLKWCERCDDNTIHMENQCVEAYLADGIQKHGPIQITCVRCKVKQSIRNFPRKYNAASPIRSYCKLCAPKLAKMYVLSFEGMIHGMYNRIVKRCTGKTKDTFYNGLKYCTREEFLAIARNDKSLRILHGEYIKSGRVFKFAPSAHRIDPPKGYIPGNIAFVTVSENSKEALKLKYSKKSV